MKLTVMKERFRLAFKKRPLRLEKPKTIQFPVIDICNSRCQMCKIWENKQSKDISDADLKIALSNGLFSEVTSIGFNGGEPTLRKDLPELVQATIDCLPSLTSISLITNAYKYQEVIDQVQKIGTIAKKSGINFDLMVSLDGYGDVHDRVRGKPGNFDRAKHVTDFAKQSPVVDNLRIGCTVIRENVYDLAHLLDYCIENDLYVKYRQGVPHQRLYTENVTEPYALTFDEKYEFVEFLEGLIKNYEDGYFQNHFYRSLIDQILHSAPRRAGCDWKHRGATITAKGELAYCAVKSKSLMPSISEGDPESVYFENEDHLRDIINNECDDCHHDYVGIPDRKDYLRYLLSQIFERLSLKRKLALLPGFSSIQRKRQKKQFDDDFRRYNKVPESIRLNDTSSNQYARKIMICGWYGTETLGDKAIIGGIISTIRSTFGHDVGITVASLFPYVTQVTKRQMPEFEGVNVVGLEEAIAAVANHHCLLFGGGPMMAINELAPIQVIFERAKKASVKTIAASVGVGPLGNAWLNESIGKILALCDIRIFRDEKSLENASKLGVDVSNDVVAEDPAFTWLDGLGKFKASESHEKPFKTLLLGLRDFPYREYARDLGEKDAVQLKENYEQSVVKALEKLVEQNPNWVIKPLPMCTNHFGNDDRWFYRRIFRGNKSLKPFLDYSLLGRELQPSEYVDSFLAADVLLGMRFHSVVFGLGLGLKTVAIDYTMGKGKVKALSERFGVQSLSMEELSPDRIHSVLEQVYKDRSDQMKLTFKELKFSETLRGALESSGAAA